MTRLDNLYNVGDGVRPSGWTGLPSCAQTGLMVADAIKSAMT